MPTHPYFTDKARAVFAAAGADPGLSDTLAAWAEAFRAGPDYDSRVGVIVAEDGTILAETRHTPATGWSPGATYVTGIHAYLTGSAEWDSLVGREVGLACGSLRRLAGQDVIHVTASQVCMGAATRKSTRLAEPPDDGEASSCHAAGKEDGPALR